VDRSEGEDGSAAAREVKRAILTPAAQADLTGLLNGTRGAPKGLG
jgi:hypothetical protein